MFWYGNIRYFRFVVRWDPTPKLSLQQICDSKRPITKIIIIRNIIGNMWKINKLNKRKN